MRTSRRPIDGEEVPPHDVEATGRHGIGSGRLLSAPAKPCFLAKDRRPGQRINIGLQNKGTIDPDALAGEQAS